MALEFLRLEINWQQILFDGIQIYEPMDTHMWDNISKHELSSRFMNMLACHYHLISFYRCRIVFEYIKSNVHNSRKCIASKIAPIICSNAVSAVVKMSSNGIKHRNAK